MKCITSRSSKLCSCVNGSNGTHETLIDVSLITVRSMAFTKIVSILPSDGVNVSFRLMNFKNYA